MGQPKLLLPWGDGLLIDQVLAAWTASQVAEVVIVVRQDDIALTKACHRWPVRVIHPPDDPADMKESIQIGLRAIKANYEPTDRDRCFIAPADLPTLTAGMIDRLIATEPCATKIVVPEFGGQQGHPALLPWALTKEIFDLGADQGVNLVVERHEKLIVAFPHTAAVSDVDTPEDYRRARDSAAKKPD